MSDQHPGGVAGRVRDRNRVFRERLVAQMDAAILSQEELHPFHMAIAVHDAHVMTLEGVIEEFDAEARRQFAELRLSTLPDDPDLSREDQIHAKGFVAGFQYLAEHLSLDLNEQEDVSRYNGDPLDFADVDLNEQDGDK